MLTRRDALVLPALLALKAQPATAPLTLQAGPLSLLFEPKLGFVRYIRFGEHEVLRGIYAAVRDSVWGTVAPNVTNVVTDVRPEGFSITFDVACRRDEIDFAWKGRVTGQASGEIRFTFEGEARSDFERNRIGFCVLHPIAECAGKACTIETGDGQTTRGNFPLLIAPHQPFLNMKSVSHQLPNGANVNVRFEGDLFEMEDHRNWTDGNYKTYCTPLAKPFPVKVAKGDKVSQSITVTVRGGNASAAVQTKKAAEVNISVAPSATGKVPRLGSTFYSGPRFSHKLPWAHLRFDLDMANMSWTDFRQAHEIMIGQQPIGIELALHLTSDAEAELEELASKRLPLTRCLIFKNGENSTNANWLTLARQHLKGVPIGGGTNFYFTELNRERPAVDLIDLACYSLNPQVHAFDDTSLVENLEAQGDTLRTARSFLGNKPIAVTPVTLRPRFNPQAKPPRALTPPDPRQSTPFAAAWTLGSIKYLAENGANSVTYYETHGPGGVVDHATPYPMHQVFQDILPLQGAAVHAAKSSHPLEVVALVMVKDRRRVTMITNLTPEAKTARCPHTTANGLVPLPPYAIRKFETAI